MVLVQQLEPLEIQFLIFMSSCVCMWWQDLSPGSVEEAEEAEPDDEFKDAIEVSTLVFSSSGASLFRLLVS